MTALRPLVAATLAALAAISTAHAATSATETAYSPGAVQIKAPYAWSLNAAGKNVVVGVIDSGIDARNKEFAAAGKIRAGYNFVDNNTNTNDTLGHGTHVSGIIAAGQNGTGMQGIAYDATILPMRVFGSSGSGSLTTMFNAMNWSIGKTRLLNMSLGWSVDYGSQYFKNAVNAGQLVVVAAGNDGGANPSWPARYGRETWAKHQIIAVGAVDSKNVIASFSNRAGDTMNNYIVAPGVNILSTYPTAMGGSYAYMSGTSMATPYVTGAAATLMGYWPALTADQVGDILLRTATDLGAPGTDAVYGRGLLNLQAALQPIGTMKTSTSTSYVNAITSWLKTAPATGAAVRSAAASGKLTVAGFDDYSRDYYIDLGNNVSPRTAFSLDNLFTAADVRMRTVDAAMGEARLTMQGAAPVFATEKLGLLEAGRMNDGARLAGFAYSARDYAIGAGGMAEQVFGFAGEVPTNGFAGKALASPYLALVPDHSFVATNFKLGEGTLRAGALTGGSGSLSYVGGLAQQAPAASAMLMEYSRAVTAGRMTFAVGNVTEKGAMLSGYGTGGFDAGRANTSFVETTYAERIAPQTWFAARAALGRTTAGQSAAFIESTSATTVAWSAGVVRSSAFVDNDRLGFAVSQPIRAIAGNMRFTASTGADEFGNPVVTSQNISLRPPRTEIDTELNYFRPVGELGGITATLLLRNNPEHEAGRETVVGLRYLTRF